MKQRSLLAVVLLPWITFAIYPLYWFVSTKNEMNRLGANIPSAWLLIFPLVQIFWLWKWSQGVEQVTRGNMSTIGAFLITMFVPLVGHAIIQDSFNRVGATESSLPRAQAI